MSDIESCFSRGCISGCIVAIMWVGTIILSWFVEIVAVISPLITLVVVGNILSTKKIKNILLSWIVSVVVTLIIIWGFYKSNIFGMAYRIFWPYDERITAGDGFCVFIITILYFGILLFSPLIAYWRMKQKEKVGN